MVSRIQTEATTEVDLLKAVTHVKLILKSWRLMLMDFTSYAYISSIQGHYVLYQELKTKKNWQTKIDDNVLAECCYGVEESFDAS